MTVGKPMQDDRIRKCDLCGEGLARAVPVFFRVSIERMGIDVGAVRAIMGLATILGSQRLASVMAPDNEVAKPIGDPDELVICHQCGIERKMSIALFAEVAAGLAERRHEATMRERSTS
jgi:hypothetical protein